ncbi:MAG: hypothetical protein DBY09_05535 [Selenomonadales bacterium]|nr:MAG: hypothetical protein DBY09_05535 [Selenomonadales bacterium]
MRLNGYGYLLIRSGRPHSCRDERLLEFPTAQRRSNFSLKLKAWKRVIFNAPRQLGPACAWKQPAPLGRRGRGAGPRLPLLIAKAKTKPQDSP